MIIKILGSGCKKCVALADNAKAAAEAASVDAQIEKVTDVVDIARYGIMSTPGLVIDEKSFHRAGSLAQGTSVRYWNKAKAPIPSAVQ